MELERRNENRFLERQSIVPLRLIYSWVEKTKLGTTRWTRGAGRPLQWAGERRGPEGWSYARLRSNSLTCALLSLPVLEMQCLGESS